MNDNILTRESLQAAINQIKNTPFPPVRDYCGPFPLGYIDQMIAENAYCPDCGRRAKDHK